MPAKLDSIEWSFESTQWRTFLLSLTLSFFYPLRLSYSCANPWSHQCRCGEDRTTDRPSHCPAYLDTLFFTHLHPHALHS